MEGKWWRSTNLQGWRGGVLMVHYLWELGRKEEPFPFPATGTILVRVSILPLYHGRREDQGLELSSGEEFP